MPARSASARAGVILNIGLLAAAVLAGCAVSSPPAAGPQAGLTCVDDSMDCIAKRKAALNSFMDDPKRGWVKEPPTAEAYASGVRLFAYKKKKKELSCDELAHGRKEADGAPAALQSAGNLLTPAQVARGRMLAAETSRELAAEMGRRCKKA